MKLRRKLLALLLVTSSFSGAYADGCGGGGHGRFSFGGGFGGGGFSMGPFQIQSSGHQYRQYSTPQYSMPSSYESSPQVIYQQPVHSIPSNSSSVPYQGQVIQGQPVMQGQPVVQGQPMNHGQPVNLSQPVNHGQPISQSQSINQGQPGQMRPQQSAQFAGQPGLGVPGQAPNNQSIMPQTSQSMPTNNMNMQSQMQPTLAPPMSGSQPAMQNRPAQPNGQLASTGGNGSGLSALQILGSMSSGNVDARPAVDSAAGMQTATQLPPSHFGTWIVNMSGNQMIKLSLNQNNTFVWSVIKEGKESRLEGQYRLDGERLVLVRSSDLQQMAGSWTGNGSNVVFKLDGASDGGLPFARAQ